MNLKQVFGAHAIGVEEDGKLWRLLETGWQEFKHFTPDAALAEENKRLRMMVVSLVGELGNGSCVAASASLEFLTEDCRREIIRHIQSVNAKMADTERRLAVAQTELSEWRSRRVTEAMLREQDGFIHVGDNCEIAIAGTSKELGKWQNAFPEGLEAHLKSISGLNRQILDLLAEKEKP